MTSLPAEELVELGRPKRRIHKRTGTVRRRTGCLTCRNRRKKCDEVYPICGHCTRLNLVCKRENPRAVLVDDQSLSNLDRESSRAESNTAESDMSTMMIPRAAPAMDINSIIDTRQGSNKRFFMKYYVQILTTLITTNQENNCFLSIFIPMAADSEAVSSALMAWSSMHLSRFDSSYTVPALEYQSNALSAVAGALCPTSTTPQDPDSTLAAALILCSIETSLGDTSGRWYDHLIGARYIIQTARSTGPNGRTLQGVEHFMQTMDGQWLLSDFAYHDVLGSVALGCPPLIRGAYWFKEHEVTLDTYAGVGSQILGWLSEISCLPSPGSDLISPADSQPDSRETSVDTLSSSSVSEDTPSETSERDIAARARSLERALKDWTPPEGPNKLLQELALSYKASALIYLYRTIRAVAPAMTEVLNHKIATYVDETLKHVKRIPVNALPECALPFPLFMAGGDTMDPEFTLYIRDRLQHILEYRGFGNCQSIIDALEELWRLKSSGHKGPTGAPVDWMDVIRAKKWKLPLF